MVSEVLSTLSTLVVTLAIPVLGFLGVQKYYIQPRQEAKVVRRKYATALYLACRELALHLASTLDRLNSAESHTAEAMRKIPNNDFHGDPAWFTKEGYQTTITAHKIAAVSAWLRLYQRELLFSSYPESQSFLKELYGRAQRLKLAFSERTCLWYYYFDALGDEMIGDGANGASVMTFASFCSRYSQDRQFRLFFEQLHMYIWFLGSRNQRYLDTIPHIQTALQELIEFLGANNLLAGFGLRRPETNVAELDEAKAAGWPQEH